MKFFVLSFLLISAGFCHAQKDSLAKKIKTIRYDEFKNYSPQQINSAYSATLFTGNNKTGKAIALDSLAKKLGKQVYRVDLSMVVSKYTGETEKNISKIFDAAQNKNRILFFDEADALFGKRSDVKNAHDKYANQEVSYLLQRIEDYKGLLILSSNTRAVADSFLQRRVRLIVDF